MSDRHARRGALKTLGLAAGTALLAAARPLTPPRPTPARCCRAAPRTSPTSRAASRPPRRRDFKTVPMILERPDQWDHAALAEVTGYRGGPKQVWDNTGSAAHG